MAALPYIVSIATRTASGGLIEIPSYASLGGTGIVIMVAGTIELWESIKSTSKTATYSYQKKELTESLTNIITNQENITSDKDDESQLW